MKKVKNNKKGTFINIFKSDGYKITIFLGRIVWYLILMIVSSFHVINNWDLLVNINMYETLTGEIIIFVIWLILLMMPFLKGIELFGIKLTSPENPLNTISKNAVEDAVKGVKDVKDEKMDDIKSETDKALSNLIEERGGQ